MCSGGDRNVVEVVVFAEGQTEEQFVKRLVAPALRSIQVYLKPQILRTSRDAKGGAISFDRLKFYARNTLRQHRNAVLTTFFDFYGLETSFPGFDYAMKMNEMRAQVEELEQALHRAIVAYVNCKPKQFIPHIQPYEFEGLLFSDVEALTTTEPAWGAYRKDLQNVRVAFASPEHINDGYETKPSARLKNILQPKYKKTRHGPLAAERITLAVIERECVHFRGWMDKLRGYGA